MSGLEKATLTKLENRRDGKEIGAPIPVQFNPASLRLTLSSHAEGGKNTGRQERQYTGNASTELSFDLVFDTADEADAGGGPRSVREKTAQVEQFVLPQGTGEQRQAPPRVKFHWGELVVTGIITSLSIDFDLFASDGTPLRAKMSVSLKEQDARYELLQAGPGSSREGNAPLAGGGGGTGPGSAGGGGGDPRSNRTGIALGGESAADFAVRMGLDAGAWRGLSAGLGSTLSLEAGQRIDFDASLGVAASVGVAVGARADLGLSLEASLGLEENPAAPRAGTTGASASLRSGLALGAAGGVSAAVATARIARGEAATRSTLQGFGAAGLAASARVKSSGAAAVSGAAASYLTPAPAGRATPAGAGRAPTPGQAEAAPAAYAPPRPDERALSFGLGVPLRPRVGGAAELNAGVVALRPYAPAREVPATRDPSTPPWRRLPATAAPTREAAPAAAAAPRPAGRSGGRTGCGCGCGPKGGAR